jgi:hypothetical protein
MKVREMRKLKKGIAVGTLLALAPIAQANAASCSAQVHSEAVAVRILQSELTVGALACDQHQQYAAFVQQHEPTLREYGSVLTDYFFNRYGRAEGQRALDSFVTRLANEASSRKSGWASHYCTFVSALHHQASSLPSASLGSFASRQPQARRLQHDDLCP